MRSHDADYMDVEGGFACFYHSGLRISEETTMDEAEQVCAKISISHPKRILTEDIIRR